MIDDRVTTEFAFWPSNRLFELNLDDRVAIIDDPVFEAILSKRNGLAELGRQNWVVM